MTVEFTRGVPERIQQGDTLRFYIDDSDYPTGQGSTYKLTLITAEKKIDLTASENTAEGRYEFDVPAAETSDYPAGDYRYELYIELAGGEVLTRMVGPLEVTPALRNMGAGRDQRSHAKRMVEAIRAVLEDTASKSQAAYTVTTAQGSRQLQYVPKGELRMLLSDYEAELRYLEDAEKLKKGLGGKGNIRVRFGG